MTVAPPEVFIKIKVSCSLCNFRILLRKKITQQNERVNFNIVILLLFFRQKSLALSYLAYHKEKLRYLRCSNHLKNSEKIKIPVFSLFFHINSATKNFTGEC